jgi:hypothetical protein
MAAHPSPRLVASRGLLQREFNRYQAAAGEQISYGSAIARWLAAQLPGADPGQLGWGILAVTALLCPDSAPILRPAIPRRKSSERRGERTSMILASRVGEALVESAGAPGGQACDALEIGPELALLDISGTYADFAGLGPGAAAQADPRREFQQTMADGLGEIRRCLIAELPGADIQAIGWGLIGSGMCLLVQASRVPPPRRLRPGARRRRSFRASAMRSALLLAAIGDYLVSPAASRRGHGEVSPA